MRGQHYAPSPRRPNSYTPSRTVLGTNTSAEGIHGCSGEQTQASIQGARGEAGEEARGEDEGPCGRPSECCGEGQGDAISLTSGGVADLLTLPCCLHSRAGDTYNLYREGKHIYIYRIYYRFVLGRLIVMNLFWLV